eukprot:3600062-Prorocentrum_lima.AAC.1
MTSSLVGSEMCIRDRCSSPASRRGECGRGLPELGAARCCERACDRGHGSVSYTHLTLPTICSV